MKSISRLRSFTFPGNTPKWNDHLEKPSNKQTKSIEDLQTEKLHQLKEAVDELDLPIDFESDDYNYLKWLIARGYHVEKAKEMLGRHLEWRKTCPYLQNLSNYRAPHEIIEQVKWKRLGNDSDGRPIFCVLAGRIDIQYLLKNHLLEDAKKYIQSIFETYQTVVNEQRRVHGCGKAIILIDMNEFSMAKAMSIEVIQYAGWAASMFEANYPETLYRAFIINSNWFFTTVYNIMKPFLAQETIDRIQLFGYDEKKFFPALSASIPIELIPEEYGGTGESIEEFELIP